MKPGREENAFEVRGESGGAGFVQTLPEDPAVAAGFVSADGTTMRLQPAVS